MTLTALVIAALVLSVASLALSGYLLVAQSSRTAPEQELDELNDYVSEIEEQIFTLSQEHVEKETRIKELENQMANLHEFVNTGIKKMSARAQKAEEKNSEADLMKKLLEQNAALNNSSSVDQIDLFGGANGEAPNDGRRIRRRRK